MNFFYGDFNLLLLMFIIDLTCNFISTRAFVLELVMEINDDVYFNHINNTSYEYNIYPGKRNAP